MKRTKKWLLVVLCLMGVLCLCSGCKQKSNVVITYNTPQDWVNWGNVLMEFTNKTKITAPNDNKNSGQSLTALIAEKTSPLCDMVYLGISFGPQAVAEDVLQSYKHTYFDQIDDSLKNADGLYSTVHYGSIAILVNTDVLGDLPIPQSWEDLLDPKYKGMIGMLDPTSAAVGYSGVVAVNEAMGGSLDDFSPAIEYFKELNKNDVVYPMQTSTAKLLKGEIGILIDADFNGYGLKYDQDGPIEIVIPKEGTVKIPYIVGIVKDCPDLDNAKKLVDFLFSEEGQALFAKGYVRPINTEALTDDVKTYFLPDEDYARAVDVDWQKMSEVQAAFNELWVAEVSGS
ncbi:MAG: extracellular solute-binding protein [Clostridiales bacterium]|nr:extracellular solute-binding protein [Clostridiales bacterium]